MGCSDRWIVQVNVQNNSFNDRKIIRDVPGRHGIPSVSGSTPPKVKMKEFIAVITINNHIVACSRSWVHQSEMCGKSKHYILSKMAVQACVSWVNKLCISIAKPGKCIKCLVNAESS